MAFGHSGVITVIGQHWANNSRPLPDTNTISGFLEVAVGGFVIIWAIVFFITLIKAPAVLYFEIEEKYESTQTRLDSILSEYTYALQLEGINFQLNGIDTEKQNATQSYTAIQSILRLKNTINRPLHYQVIDFEVNGISQNGLLFNAGGGLGPLSSTLFLSAPINASPKPKEAEIVDVFVVIYYGPPNMPPVRKMVKKARIPIVPEWSPLGYPYEIDKDEPI